MRATRNTVRLNRTVNVPSFWEDVKEWANRNITNETVAEVSLALATAVTICYLGSRLYLGLQNYEMFAY